LSVTPRGSIACADIRILEEAVAERVLGLCQGMVEPVPMRSVGNRAEEVPLDPRLQPLRANDAPQQLKPPASQFGTTKVVPGQGPPEVLQQEGKLCRIPSDDIPKRGGIAGGLTII
jgi:hypothetical protein